MTTFAKPENALKRADGMSTILCVAYAFTVYACVCSHLPAVSCVLMRCFVELVSINASGDALKVLHSVITAKKFRNWQPILEKIMLKYIDLCVEQRKGKMAKDGLHQYRVTCQQYNNYTGMCTNFTITSEFC